VVSERILIDEGIERRLASALHVLEVDGAVMCCCEWCCPHCHPQDPKEGADHVA